MHAALMLPHQLVEAAGRDLLSFTRNSRIQSCGQRRLHFAPLVLSIWTSLRAPGLQPASKCLRPLLWAMLAALLQFVPHLGPPLGLIGPVLSAALHWKDWLHPIYVLILYAAVAVLDGLLLQPYIMRRTAKVPIWASILAPIVLGFVIPFWGVLLAPPLLAVLFAYRSFLTDSRS